MNIALRRRPLNHGVGDLVNACYAVPQNPIIKGLTGLGNGSGNISGNGGGVPLSEQYYWNGNGASCGAGMCSTPGAVAAANSGGLQPGIQSSGAASGIQSVQSMTMTIGPAGLAPVPQTVVTEAATNAQPQAVGDAVWYYTPGGTTLTPKYQPQQGSVISITFTPSLPSTSVPMPPQIYVPSTAPAAQPMPSATTSQPPSITQAAATPAAMAAGARWKTAQLSPQQLMKPLPQIVTHNPLPDVNLGCTDAFAQWVNNNALLVGLGLVAAFFMVSGGSGGGGSKN